MQNIVLFCASSDQMALCYFEAAKSLGCWLGRQRKRLIYGGFDGGLMEETARSVKNNGGLVTGVITSELKRRGRTSQYPDEWVEVETLSARKQIMMDRGEVFIALPGGIGTIDEMFDVLATAQLGYHTHLLIICNLQGFYNDLLRQIDTLYSTRFAPMSGKDHYRVVGSIEECMAVLQELDLNEK